MDGQANDRTNASSERVGRVGRVGGDVCVSANKELAGTKEHSLKWRGPRFKKTSVKEMATGFSRQSCKSAFRLEGQPFFNGSGNETRTKSGPMSQPILPCRALQVWVLWGRNLPLARLFGQSQRRSSGRGMRSREPVGAKGCKENIRHIQIPTNQFLVILGRFPVQSCYSCYSSRRVPPLYFFQICLPKPSPFVGLFAVAPSSPSSSLPIVCKCACHHICVCCLF